MNTTAQSQAPLITQAPDAALVARILLRQVENVVTCGYVDGNINSPASCASSSTCASNLEKSVHFCCPNPSDCVMPTTCYAATDLSNGVCGNSCMENTSILKCTGLGYANCYTRLWAGATPLSGFGCAPSPFEQTVYTTFLGENTQTTSSQETSSAQSSSATSTFSSNIVSPTGTPSSSNTSSTHTSTSIQTQSSSSGPVLSPGAIAGIVIGAAFFICFLVVLAISKSRRWIAEAIGIRGNRGSRSSTEVGHELQDQSDIPGQGARQPSGDTSLFSRQSIHAVDHGPYETF